MYVGKTVQKLKSRLYSHISKSKKTNDSKKDIWITETLNKNNYIKIKIIEICDSNNWTEREIHWIKEYSKVNGCIKNSTKGGEGGSYCKKYKLTYSECREIVQKLNISTIKEYKTHPEVINNINIPSNPLNVYELCGWVSWVDFLGNGRISNSKRNFITYEECQKYALDNNIKSYTEWCKFKNRTPDIPSNPQQVYKHKWVNWDTFLMNGKVSNHYRTFIGYEECKKYATDNNIKSKSNWFKHVKDVDIPVYIPKCPRSHFKKLFKGWCDFLSNDNTITQEVSKLYYDYIESKTWVSNNLSVKSVKEWEELVKNKLIPEFIPNRPQRFYKNKNRGWIDWYDFLNKERPLSKNNI